MPVCGIFKKFNKSEEPIKIHGHVLELFLKFSSE